ncbi:MAG: hypothetical protein F9K14_03540 [Candidatus Methanoperedens sp.]|nr:MAG: hypothetical protein F9K14_03540 [Candidatus Methanoperedens sp.]MBZ0175131.1 hypothetical protein [Candidatus Methanoperedens nitroreducens]
MEKSLEELEYILNWIKQREDTANNPTTVLIGGWAIDAYNPWYGSIDIDLVTNNRTKHSLMHILHDEREYDHYRIGVHTVYKQTDYGPIIIDFASRDEHYPFEGRVEELNFDIPNGQTIIQNVRNQIFAAVPTRSLLMLFKLKASWDRAYRLNSETSTDPEWEHGKLIKDYADIIALIDPMHGGRELDFDFLGEKLTEFDFLRGCLRIIPENLDAIGKYGRMDQRAVRETIERLLQLTE